MANITKAAESYIAEHPSVKDCLKKGIVNYSALSRQISVEKNLDIKKNFDAILIACRRYKEKVKKEEILEKDIMKILAGSKVEIKNKVMAVVLEKDVHNPNLIDMEKEIKKRKEMFTLVEGLSGITIITSEEFSGLISRYFKNKIVIENKNLAEITIKSPKEIETTPGTYAYLCSLFSDNNINIVETLSCWTDTIFLIKGEDIGKAANILKF